MQISQQTLMQMQEKLQAALQKMRQSMLANPKKILYTAILAYTILFSVFSLFKYTNFLYNGIDLAIFNQVFYNTAHGRWFQFSIHPHSYLGDHFSPIILFLIPFYAIFQHPATLLILQTIILAATAVPVYLIAKQKGLKPPLDLAAALLWLVNPILHNINLFEFEILPISILPLLFALYFYFQKQYRRYLLSLIIGFLVREDVTLVVFMYGLLPLIEHAEHVKRTVSQFLQKIVGAIPLPKILQRPLKQEQTQQTNTGSLRLSKKDAFYWMLIPIILSIAYFFLSLTIIGHYNTTGQYKFLFYYSWMGESFGKIFLFPLQHPLQFMQHLFTVKNIEMILGFLFAFFFLPIFSRRYLLLAAGPLVQILLGLPGGSSFILSTHYASLFLPALALSAIVGFSKAREKFLLWRASSSPAPNSMTTVKFPSFRYIRDAIFQITNAIKCDKNFIYAILSVFVLYLALIFGPFGHLLYQTVRQPFDIRAKAKQELIRKIPKNAVTAASYEFLPNLSSREKLYSLHYLFLGTEQFAARPYTVDTNIEYLLINAEDFIAYQFGYQTRSLYSSYAAYGDNRIREMLLKGKFGVIKIVDNYILLKKNYQSEILLYTRQKNGFLSSGNSVKNSGNSDIGILGYRTAKRATSSIFNPCETLSSECTLVPIEFSFQTNNETEKNYSLRMRMADKKGKTLWENISPIAYGLYPTSEWKKGEVVKTDLFLLLPPFLPEKHRLFAAMVDIDGKVLLKKDRSSDPKFSSVKMIGGEVEIHL